MNYAGESVKVRFDEKKTSFSDLDRALREIGYGLVRDLEASLEEQEKSERRRLSRQRDLTIAALAFSAPVVLISMVLPTIPHENWIMAALTFPVLFIFGREFFINAIKRARHGQANMDTLVALGTGAAFLFSIFNTLFPGYLERQGLVPHVYYEAAAVIISLILLGRYFEHRSRSRTSRSLKKLMSLGVKTALVVKNGSEKEVAVEDIQRCDTLLIKPGGKIPVDGKIIEGETFIDESMITGEPEPVEKTAGQQVLAGTVNGSGSLLMRAEKIGNETLLAQIIQSVEEAQSTKAPIQRLADKVAGIFVPIVISIAMVSFILWYIFGPHPSHTYAFVVLITVLIIACPCALGLATPTAITVGVGRAAEKGILIKDAQSLELAHQLDVVVFDKTGTLTEGKPRVVSWLPASGHENKRDIMGWVLSAEKRSEHPLGRAIVDHLTSREVQAIDIDRFESYGGKGIAAKADNKLLHIGSASFLDSAGYKIPEEILSGNQGATLVFVGYQGTVEGAFVIRDNLKASSREALIRLKEAGLEVHLLSGDRWESVSAIAEEAGISHYEGSMLPQEKAAYIQELQSRGLKVAMAGDGINDAPALARADVSIAMGTGTDVAIETANITIVKGDLQKVADAILISGSTVKTIRQNLFWAFIYNVIGIPVAAGVLFPLTGMLLNPMIAGAAMAFSSVSVVSNSLRLKKKIR